MASSKRKPSRTTKPESGRLAVHGDWKDAIKKAVSKKRPAEGWPDRPVKPRRSRRKKDPS